MRFALFLALLLFSGLVQAQSFQDPFVDDEQNEILGGLGITWIDGQPYTTFTLAPEFAVGNIGVGLQMQFLFDNEDGFKLRDDEFKDGPGILRVIRYLRYGRKYDPYYFRVGALDRAMLANGFLMWNYNNGSNYDKRRIGLVADVDLQRFGVETVWGSVGTSSIKGANVYVRPFRFGESAPPILQRFRIYVNGVRDNNLPQPTPEDSARTTNLTALGIGADLQWLDIKVLKSSIYADWAQFQDYGSGKAVGINLIFPEFIGLFGVAAKFEKRFINEQFIPGLFGPLYELQRELDLINTLENTRGKEGYFGELSGHVLNRLRLIGSFQKLNGVDSSGALHLEASAPDLVPSIELRATYDKVNIEKISDVGTLDVFSNVAVEVGYQLNQFMLLSTVYRWYWVEDPNNPGTFEPVERIEPRISFRYRF